MIGTVTFFLVGVQVFAWNLYFKMITTKNVLERKKVMMLTGKNRDAHEYSADALVARSTYISGIVQNSPVTC